MAQPIKVNQKITDFVTEFAGTLEELFNVANENNCGITDELKAGTLLTVTPVNTGVVNFYNNSVCDIVTVESKNIIQPGGIDYMQIEHDFTVS